MNKLYLPTSIYNAAKKKGKIITGTEINMKFRKRDESIKYDPTEYFIPLLLPIEIV